MKTELLTVALGIAVLFCLVYGVLVRNDLARRWERLRGLAANVSAFRQRRQGVGRDVARHLSHAQRHERRVTESGARRGRYRGGRFIDVSDVNNGWPTASTTDVTSQGMGLDVRSRDAESAARAELHADAQAYNAVVKSW